MAKQIHNEVNNRKAYKPKGERMKWQKKITKKQLRHIKETTDNGTLREFKANREHHRNREQGRDLCYECRIIAIRLKLEI